MIFLREIIRCLKEYGGFDSVDKESPWCIMAANGVSYLALRFIKAYLALNQDKWICPGVRQGCAVSPTLFNWIYRLNSCRPMQDYSRIQVGANVHVSVLTYVDGTVLLNNNNSNTNNNNESNNREMIKTIKTVPPQLACVLTHGRPRCCKHSSLLSSVSPSCLVVSPWSNVDSMFTTSDTDTEEVRSIVTLARPTFYRFQSCHWSRREISLRTKCMVYHTAELSISLKRCEMCPVRATDDGMLVIIDKDNNHCILWVGHRDRVPYMRRRRKLLFTCLPAKFVQKGHAARCPQSVLIGSPFCSHRIVHGTRRPANNVGRHGQANPGTSP